MTDYVLELPSLRARFISDDIIMSVVPQDFTGPIDEQTFEDHRKAMIELTEKYPDFGLLFVVPNVNITLGTRCESMKNTPFGSAVALLVEDKTTKHTAEYLLAAKTVETPMEIFSEEDKAIEWLKEKIAEKRAKNEAEETEPIEYVIDLPHLRGYMIRPEILYTEVPKSYKKPITAEIYRQQVIAADEFRENVNIIGVLFKLPEVSIDFEATNTAMKDNSKVCPIAHLVSSKFTESTAKYLEAAKEEDVNIKHFTEIDKAIEWLEAKVTEIKTKAVEV